MVKRGCGLGHAHSGLITVTCLWYELNFSVILFTQECVRNNIRFRWWSKMKSSCYFSSSKRVSKSLLFKITIIKKQCCACLCYKPRPSGQGEWLWAETGWRTRRRRLGTWGNAETSTHTRHTHMHDDTVTTHGSLPHSDTPHSPALQFLATPPLYPTPPLHPLVLLHVASPLPL